MSSAAQVRAVGNERVRRAMKTKGDWQQHQQDVQHDAHIGALQGENLLIGGFQFVFENTER
jgi:hypothetical protein